MALCEGCSWSIYEFIREKCSNPDALLEVWYTHGLLHWQKDCERCGQPSRVDLRRKQLRCDKTVSTRKQKKQRCGWHVSLLNGSIFKRAHLDVNTLLVFVNYFIREYFTVRLIQHELGLELKTITDWSTFCQEVMVHWALEQQGVIGGPGRIVEIIESKFWRSKYNVGRVVDGQWGYGGICRETRNLFLVPVANRTSDALLAVIKERIAPGSIIIFDCWKIYNCLSQEEYNHLTVNQTYQFIDPDKLAELHNIERQWKEAKRKVPLCGHRKKHLVKYLARSMFLMHFEDHNIRLHHFLCAAASVYPPV